MIACYNFPKYVKGAQNQAWSLAVSLNDATENTPLQKSRKERTPDPVPMHGSRRGKDMQDPVADTDADAGATGAEADHDVTI